MHRSNPTRLYIPFWLKGKDHGGKTFVSSNLETLIEIYFLELVCLYGIDFLCIHGQMSFNEGILMKCGVNDTKWRYRRGENFQNDLIY